MPLDLIFEHRAYFPAFFLALALTDLLLWGLGRLATPRPWRVALGATMALAALAGGFSLQRNRLLADPLLLWRDTVSKAPGSLRVRQQYSLELLKDPRRGEEALEQARIALARWPNSPDANHHLGVVYAWLGRTEKAIPFFEKAAQLSPRSPWVLNSLAYGYSALGRHGEALELCRRAIALSPGYARAHYNLGISLIGLGREAEAMAVWRTLQGIDPTLALRLRTAMPRAGR